MSMRRIITLLFVMILSAATLFAQAPQRMSYQAVVRNSQNQLVTEQSVSVRISILQGSVTGAVVYSETHTAMTNANGLLTIEIGGGTTSDTFDQIEWANGPFFLKSEIDPAGGINYSIESVQQLMSVPYALYATRAGNGFSGDYNDLTNTPQIPQIPSNVSAFTNDAGYITMDSVPTIPTNVSVFTNDAGYVTMDSIPTNVSAFANDAGYLTNYTETDPTVPAWAKEANKPAYDYSEIANTPIIPTVPSDVSAFNNDAGYITMDSVPTIPANVSAFTNDAGYLTNYTETDPTVPAWAKEANKPAYDYSEIANTPTIPTLPTNVSAFNNDAGYITMDSVPTIPTNVSTFANDAGYLTNYTETDPTVPAWAKEANKPSYDYSEIANTPTIPTVPTDVSAFNNDAGYITMDSVPSIPTNVSTFANDAGYLTEASCNGVDICELFNALAELQAQVDSFQQASLLPVTQILPAVTTAAVFDIMATSATCGGEVTSDSGFVVIAKGVCWNTTGTPTVFDNHTIDGGGMGDFLSDLQALTPGTTYFVRAFAMNSTGTAYGDEIAFTTAPTIFTCGGNLIDANNSYTTSAYGSQCWMTENLRKANGSDSFNWVDAICPSGWHLPTAAEWDDLANYVNNYSTQDSNIPLFFAHTGSEYWVDMTMPYQEGGTQYTLSLPCCISGQQISSNCGIAYEVHDGEENSVHVRCVKEAVEVIANMPTVTTAAISNIAATSAISGGEVTSDGGFAVSAKGVCWNTTGSPTISDNHTLDGGGTGGFFSNLQALTPDTTYFVRAYATNSMGTVYGEQVSFITTEGAAVIQGLPSVTTAAVSNIAATSATCGGEVTSDSGSVVIAKGVCWNTTGSPTISDNHTVDGGGTGLFLSNLQALNPGTYFVRAYATNSSGTAYGEEVTFMMAFTCGSNLIDGSNSYTTNAYGSQCWMTQNLRKANGSDIYSWVEASQSCPAGWHLPTAAEWDVLANYVNNNIVQDSNIPLFFAYIGSEYWVDMTMSWQDLEGDPYTLSLPCCISGQQISSNCGIAYDIDEGEAVVSVRCVREVEVDQALPTVMTKAVPNITATNVICGGEVISDGGSVVSAKGVCWNTTGTPTISDNHTISGGGVGPFFSELQGLIIGKTYYLRSYAINSTGINYGLQVSFTVTGYDYQTWDGTSPNPNDALPCQGAATVTDHEGNVYNTVQIGNQCWTRENMRCTTSPSTGTTILEYPASSYSYTGKKAYYVDGSAENTATYGLLYNWWAATDTFNTVYGETSTDTNRNHSIDVAFSGYRRGICPTGWHVPSVEEYQQLLDYVGSQSSYICNNGRYSWALLSTTMWGWDPDQGDGCFATINATGFSAVPAGSGSHGSEFGMESRIWTSHGSGERAVHLMASIPSFCGTGHKSNGLSVRCLRDEQVLPTVTTLRATNVGATSATCGGEVTGAEVDVKGVCWNTTGSPTISDNHTVDGSGTGSFLSELQTLTLGTTYFVRAYATNNVGTVYGEEVSFTTTAFTCGDSLVDGNNSYSTNLYGSQCWMTENLRKANGSESFSWMEASQSCPAGWHLPTETDWNTFASYVNNNSAQDSSIPLFFVHAGSEYWMDKTHFWSDGELDLTLGMYCVISGAAINGYFINTITPNAYPVDEEGTGVLTRCVRD